MKSTQLGNFLFGKNVDSLSPLIATLIIINSIAIFIEAFPSINPMVYSVSRWVDYFCVWGFFLEAFSKLQRFGWKSYINKNWNRFDLTLIVLSFPALLMPVLNTQEFGVILTLRWAKLVRLGKILAFVPKREKMLAGIRRALGASLYVWGGLIFLLIFASLSGTMFFGGISPELFGNPFISAYSMFKIFTIEGWFEIPAALIQGHNAGWWALFVRLYFILFVVAGGMMGLSMLNAVFVDALVEDNNEKVEQRLDKIEALLERFEKKLDSNLQNLNCEHNANKYIEENKNADSVNNKSHLHETLTMMQSLIRPIKTIDKTTRNKIHKIILNTNDIPLSQQIKITKRKISNLFFKSPSENIKVNNNKK